MNLFAQRMFVYGTNGSKFLYSFSLVNVFANSISLIRPNMSSWYFLKLVQLAIWCIFWPNILLWQIRKKVQYTQKLFCWTYFKACLCEYHALFMLSTNFTEINKTACLFANIELGASIWKFNGHEGNRLS